MTNIILCGGVGSRLWPLSRMSLPKQFSRILPGDTLFEATIRRNQLVCDQFLIASNQEQAYLAADQLHGLGVNEWGQVIEPIGRNTAPAIALACFQLEAEELVFVTPSDHMVANIPAYIKAVNQAVKFAEGGNLVTFGIKPSFPETGFGYIQTVEPTGGVVSAFHEKPELELAKSYLASGKYWWNSGMFCFKAGVFLDELKHHSPEVYYSVKAVAEDLGAQAYSSPSYECMVRIPSISIDYAVMEKSKRVVCVPCDIGWSDLGSFDSLYEEVKQSCSDSFGNALVCTEKPLLLSSFNNLIINNERKVVLVDVQDLLVVETHDALLISKRGTSQRVKEVVDLLREQNSPLIETFPRNERAWGVHSVLHEEEGCRIKRVEIRPGESLGFHMHEHREENFYLVQGSLDYEVDKQFGKLEVGEFLKIKRGKSHKLSNNGEITVVLVEIHDSNKDEKTDIIRLN